MWYRFVKTPENELNHARKIHLGKLRYRDFKEDADQHPDTKFFAYVHASLSVLQTHVDPLANPIVKAKNTAIRTMTVTAELSISANLRCNLIIINFSRTGLTPAPKWSQQPNVVTNKLAPYRHTQSAGN